jgi:hypothetical protein
LHPSHRTPRHAYPPRRKRAPRNAPLKVIEKPTIAPMMECVALTFSSMYDAQICHTPPTRSAHIMPYAKNSCDAAAEEGSEAWWRECVRGYASGGVAQAGMCFLGPGGASRAAQRASKRACVCAHRVGGEGADVGDAAGDRFLGHAAEHERAGELEDDRNLTEKARTRAHCVAR